ncbi:MAG TPA: squalene/phytoene synthase family protein [Caulobacteraceae bacterium]|nr:squalene/phytoene synthase family protein [Caulobacteraceae bacterium]
MSETALDVDHSVARADPDRWLASRFVDDREARADLIALYAFDHELARALAVASEPLMAEIRLTWWSEALDEMFERRPVRAHPVAQALALAVQRRGLARGPLDSLIDARLHRIDDAPFADEGALFAHLDGTAGAVMQAAAAVLGRDDGLPAVQSAGRAWGLARAAVELSPEYLPQSLTPDRIRAMTRQAIAGARKALQDLPVKAFPAVAYITLAPAYAAGRRPGLLEKQARLLWAVASGRV